MISYLFNNIFFQWPQKSPDRIRPESYLKITDYGSTGKLQPVFFWPHEDAWFAQGHGQPQYNTTPTYLCNSKLQALALCYDLQPRRKEYFYRIFSLGSSQNFYGAILYKAFKNSVHKPRSI
jgi:hypothetical protein